jgi:hypothetical protein
MVKRKIKVKTDNSGWKEPKVRKKRKPMTKKQRIAASKRLEKARATKARLMEREIQNRLEEFGF